MRRHDHAQVAESQKISISRLMPAPARRIFAVLVDPRQHPLLDGSGSVLASRPGGPSRLGPRTKFSMEMKLFVSYRITNTVVDFEEGRRIAWAHQGGHRWIWQLDPEDDETTLVTETFDWSTSKTPWLVERLGFPERNRSAIEASLERLEKLLTSGDS